MPKLAPKRGPQRPLTPADLRDALSETSRDIVGHFNVRFGKVDERFDRMDKRFDGVEKRLDRVEEHLAEHDKRFTAIERGLQDGFRGVALQLKEVVTRDEIAKLLGALRKRGVVIEEREVFTP